MILRSIKYLLITFIFTANANAIIVGDKDWLQVPTTNNYSWSDIDTIFDTTTGQCDVAGCMLTAITGGASGSVDLTGYSWASNNEVNELLKAYTGGTGLSSLNPVTSLYLAPNGLDSFFADFTPTRFYTFDEIRGWTRDSTSGSGHEIQFYNIKDNTSDDAVVLTSTHKDAWGTNFGGWFYRSASVPEPSVLALMAIGFLGIGAARKLKKH